jgi:hypothetical protein
MLKYYSEYLHLKLGCEDYYTYSLGDDYPIFAKTVNITNRYKTVTNYQLLRSKSVFPEISIDTIPRLKLKRNIGVKASDALRGVKGTTLDRKLDIGIINSVLNIRLITNSSVL